MNDTNQHRPHKTYEPNFNTTATCIYFARASGILDFNYLRSSICHRKYEIHKSIVSPECFYLIAFIYLYVEKINETTNDSISSLFTIHV